MSARSRRRTGIRDLLLPFLAAHVLFVVLWLLNLARNGPTENDWLHLKIVADHFVAGDWSRLYATGPDAINPGYFWRYPPFALYLVAPLAWLSPVQAYSALTALGTAALLASIGLLRHLAPPRGMDAEWALAIALSAPAITTLIVGQSSALMLLCVTAAAAVWSRKGPLQACALLGLLALKPNWGAFFGLFVLVRGERRGAMMMVGVVLALCVAALPLGIGLWSDFIRTSMSNTGILADYAYYKQITLKGFLEAVFGPNVIITTLWAGAAAGLIATAVASWRVPGPPIRHLSLVILLAVAVNPYASFYDALLLALPAAVWWSERTMWRPAWWRAVGWLLAAAWCWEHYSFSWGILLVGRYGIESPFPPFSIVGPVASIWLVVAAWEAITAGTRGNAAPERAIASGTTERAGHAGAPVSR